MPRMIRPPYILAHIADMGGCGFHRIIRPLTTLVGHGVANGRADMRLWMDAAALKNLDPQVVIWQRQHDDKQIAAIKFYREVLPNAFHVYEMDDCMSAAPEWSPHTALIPFEIDKKMCEAQALCDVIVVSTNELADHVRSITSTEHKIRVVPNMLTREDVDRLAAIRKIARPHFDRVRIGWCGGFGHKGDLDLLIPAMRELHNKGIEWVFMGQRPECEVPVEYHPGDAPTNYLARFASLNLDLVVVPLVDNKFNQCKSNIKLLEAGLMRVPVIASSVAPYLTDKPPVYAYAGNADDWLKEINRFLSDRDAWDASGEKMLKWVDPKYIIDSNLEKRIEAWMPEGAKSFKPPVKQSRRASAAVLVAPDKTILKGTRYTTYSSLQDALNGSTGSIIYVRSGTTVTDDQLDRIVRRLNQGANTASVIPMSNDGGIAAFPKQGQFSQAITAEEAANLDAICKQLFTAHVAEALCATGPVVAISRNAIDFLGWPDVGPGADTESSLFEWTGMASSKGFENQVASDVFVHCMAPYMYPAAQASVNRIQARFPLKQLPPDPMAPVRSELELAYHRQHHVTPQPSTNKSYAEYAALFNEIGEVDKQFLATLPEPPVWRYPFNCSSEYSKPVPFMASPDLPLEEGPSWVILCHEDTELSAAAGFMFTQAILANPDAVILYADHDVKMPDNSRDRFDCKPHRFDSYLFAQRDYVTPVMAIKWEVLDAMLQSIFGIWSTENIEITDTVLYELLLSMIFEENDLPIVNGDPHVMFTHVPRILGSMKHQDPTAAFAVMAGKCRIATQVTPFNITPTVVDPTVAELSFAPCLESSKERPKVSIIIPTLADPALLSPCLNSVLKTTNYPNFEVIVVTNGTVHPTGKRYLETLNDERVNIVYYDKAFNWAKLNNWAVKKASGELLLFLNDDTQVIEPHWLNEMVGAWSSRDKIGAVGARLLHLQGTVQHVGVVCNKGQAGHYLKGAPESSSAFAHGLSLQTHEATAVTGACMLVASDVFEDIGGFDERFALNFNDLVFCLELNRRGYTNIVVAKAQLRHIESASRGFSQDDVEMALVGKVLRREQELLSKEYVDEDPYWNPNLFFQHTPDGMYVMGMGMDILHWPPAAWPWRDSGWGRENVLMIGDDGSGWVKEANAGNAVYLCMFQGYGMKIARPLLDNIPPMDIRDNTTPVQVLNKLGITKIVIRSLLGAAAEVLPFITRLGFTVEYRPATAEAVCPRLDFKTRNVDNPEFVDCHKGWTNIDRCTACILNNGSPFGAVSVVGWRDHWSRFLREATCDVAPDKITANAIEQVYPDQQRRAPSHVA